MIIADCSMIYAHILSGWDLLFKQPVFCLCGLLIDRGFQLYMWADNSNVIEQL